MKFNIIEALLILIFYNSNPSIENYIDVESWIQCYKQNEWGVEVPLDCTLPLFLYTNANFKPIVHGPESK